MLTTQLRGAKDKHRQETERLTGWIAQQRASGMAVPYDVWATSVA